MAGVGVTDAAMVPEIGWRAPEVEEELPALRLLASDVQVGRRVPLTGPSPPDITARLRELSNRFRGPRAVSIRREPVPAAFRVFFRHIGLDPDVVRTPIEGAVLERMMRGGFLSSGLLEDVLLIALLDTAVPVWALDTASVEGRLGIRPSREGETLGRAADASVLPAGRLVIADDTRALAVLFGELGAGHTASPTTAAVTLFAIQVAGVPTLYVEEALWSARSALEHP
ncbi:MAG TPA: phenylalanine--tRNA ligase beta subunit-related protein [Solirubrobacteraceae bacterium]|nr:phenylalanine--tRNA ligase beta subunit-related protein [Solirubrobacteraceae bacterium]